MSQYDEYKMYNKQQRDPWAHPAPYGNTQKTKVKTVTIEDLFPKLDRWAIGFDPVFATLKQLSNTAKAASYPPYNITKFGEGKFELQLALAGFRKEDLSITVEDRILTVSSEVVEDDNPAFGEVIHHGIAQRNFTQNFALAEYVEVESAKMEDGILTIKLITNLPEEKKPKSVDIH